MVNLRFCWPAFFLGPIWAAAKGSWRVFFLFLVVSAVCMSAEAFYLHNNKSLISEVIVWAGYLLVAVIAGRYGNRWLIWELKKQGYVTEIAEMTE